MDRFLLICIFMAFVITTFLGAGNIPIASMLGLLLCAAGMVQSSARIDPWTLAPLLAYHLVSLASSWAAHGNITEGYASNQGLFPVLYLLIGCLQDGEDRILKRLCVLWTGAAAAGGIVQFVYRAVALGSARRVGGFLGNPNAMGIFLVLGWFALLGLLEDRETREQWPFACLEPLLLLALALTLSLGSFAAMAAGIACLLLLEGRRSTWRKAFTLGCRLLARASLGVGAGMLVYLSAARTGRPWLCLALLAYALAAARVWRTYDRFLEAYPRMALLIAGCGVLVAGAMVAVRPSSLATFAQRLAMMRNGLGYLPRHPLLGVGPYQWRILNLYDSDQYYNTWHIHNVLLHIGVELGWIAMAMLAALALRFYSRRRTPLARAGFTAFCFHNLMDTSFFYLGILALAMLAGSDLSGRRRELKGGTVRILCGLFAAMFAYNLIRSISSA